MGTGAGMSTADALECSSPAGGRLWPGTVCEDRDREPLLSRLRDSVALVDLNLVDARVSIRQRRVALCVAQEHAQQVLTFVLILSRADGAPSSIDLEAIGSLSYATHRSAMSFIRMSAHVSRVGRAIERVARSLERGDAMDSPRWERVVRELTGLIENIEAQRSMAAEPRRRPSARRLLVRDKGARFCSWVPSRNAWKARYKLNGRERYVGLFRVEGDGPDARARALATATAAVQEHRSRVLAAERGRALGKRSTAFGDAA